MKALPRKPDNKSQKDLNIDSKKKNKQQKSGKQKDDQSKPLDIASLFGMESKKDIPVIADASVIVRRTRANLGGPETEGRLSKDLLKKVSKFISG